MLEVLVVVLQKFLVYGCLGWLIEVFFTGVYSLFQKHWKATSNTYLWMLPIYGFAGFTLDALHTFIPWPWYLRAPLYVAVIYGIEALSGFALEKLTGLIQSKFGGSGGGVVPWNYGKSSWTPAGLINLTYAPFWLIIALLFDPVSAWFHRVLMFIARMP